jgi:predicted nucleic acid-binding Zn ribbon protein
MSGRRPKRRKSQPKQIGTMMGQVLGELGLEAAAAAFQVGQRWEEAVGPDVARHARPAGLRGNVLEVVVDSSVWSQQLQLQRREILSALRELLGEAAPGDLRFRVGYTTPP